MPYDLKIAIAQARNAKGWNQDQFSKMLQVPKSDVNSWEAGKSVPSGALIAKMDKVLGVKLPRPPKKWPAQNVIHQKFSYYQLMPDQQI